MPFILWKETNAVNVDVIDRQHRKLFDLLNQLYTAAIDEPYSPECNAILDELVEYTVHHFTTEEKLFTKYAYPALEEHKAEHHKLTAQIVKLQMEVQRGSCHIDKDNLDFLHDWLLLHTTGSDVKFGDYLRENNITVA